MANVKVIPRSLTDAYKRREGDFSPNLVGLQFTDPNAFFTFGNFQITTNISPKLSKDFILGGEWSEYYSLENLSLSDSESQILESNNINVVLNFNPYNISRYVYFGSFYELVRVTIEQIIQKWKGSIYLNPTSKTNTAVNTVLSYQYNKITGISTFLIPKSVISNPFELIVDDNVDFTDLQPDDIFNLSRDYKKYVIETEGRQYNVIGYTGSTEKYQYITVSTNGNPFTSLSGSTFGSFTYHLKPNNDEVNLFFEGLSDFESVLLNRMTVPQYTSAFSTPSDADGYIVFYDKKFTWPVSDGYNIDINTGDYGRYVESILDTANQFDLYKTDLVTRRFVSESIHQYDTDGGGDEVYGKKVNKLLRIYGREFDNVKKYIDGISFANVVTYDKLDNTSDELIKIMAKTLGFDVLLTVGTDNFNIKQMIDKPESTVFSGQSMNLSTKELDVELWRRLVINAWWLWKSKGTRKVIEFFFSLFNIPQCMITLNEFVYLVENRLDVVSVYDKLVEIYGSPDQVDLSLVPMDDYGFPRILPETTDNYFQMNGFWYNGGNDSSNGNNPHIGSYDYGGSYFKQFECFVDDSIISNLTSGTTPISITENFFNNYNAGTFWVDPELGLPIPFYGTTYANTLNTNGQVTNATVTMAGLKEPSVIYSPALTEQISPTFMEVSFTTNSSSCNTCPEITYAEDGFVYTKNDNQLLTNQSCCIGYWLAKDNNTPTSSVNCPNIKDIYVIYDDVYINKVISCYVDPNVSQIEKDMCYQDLDDRYGSVTPCTVTTQNNGSLITVPKSCCNKNTVGFDVYWDGNNCFELNCYNKIKNGLNCDGTLTITNSSITCVTQIFLEESGGWVFDSVELFSNNNEFLELTDEISQEYVCYWCLPNSNIKEVCDVIGYVRTLTVEQLFTLYNSTVRTITVIPTDLAVISLMREELSERLDNYITKYGCMLSSIDNNPIKDNSCCKLRGGNMTNGYCFIPPKTTCGLAIQNVSHVYLNTDGQMTTQDCCNNYGYWSDGTVLVDGNTIIPDTIGLSFANSLGVKEFCSACPQNISILYNTVVDSSTNTTLNRKCCIDYGYNWDVDNNRCYPSLFE